VTSVIIIVVCMTMDLLFLDPSILLPFIWDDIPHLNSLNWKKFSPVMEMLFYSQDASYLVGSDPSTTVPLQCILLDQQLFSSVLLKKIDNELKPIIAKTSSALQAWLLLTEHFQGPFLLPSPPSPSPVHDIMDINDSTIVVMDTITTSSPVNLSVDVGPTILDQNLKCSSISDQDYPIMDFRHISSHSISLIADIGKNTSYAVPFLAISSVATLIKSSLSHSRLALVKWPLTPLHLFHDWPG